MMGKERFSCRICASDDLHVVLDLGETPLANALLRKQDLDAAEPRFPLVLAFCRSCSLVQITETVPPEQLFRNYLYFSSFSETMLRHARELAERMVRERGLGSQSRIIEAASNDGYLLREYRKLGPEVLGVEPARNIAAVATEQGVPTIAEFFNETIGRRLSGEGRTADVFHANNVLAHVADLHGFVAGIQHVLKPDGVAVIESPYVRDMIEGNEFDTIYHEHLCYYSLHALDRLFGMHGLRIQDVEHLPIHGGSVRVFVVPASSPAARTERAQRSFDAERSEGLLADRYYADFAQRVDELKKAVVRKLGDLKASGKTIAAYGASAKGSTLLNAFGIGRETLDFVVDRSTHKQGYFTPGTHIPILEPGALLSQKPDYVLLLTWNFAEEILAQQKEYRAIGKFIIPIPQLRIE